MSPWLLLSAAVLLTDQTTKFLARSRLDLHEPLAVMPFLNLTLTYNPGAAFSFLSGAGGWQRWFLIVISIVVSGGVVWWLRDLPRGAVWLASALALVLGGALGNLWDRLTLGVVVDFIDLYYAGWHWPAFNLADSAIMVGALMLLVSAFQPDPGATDQDRAE